MNKIKFFLILTIYLVISSCGYEPVYSKKDDLNPELYSISVKNIKDRSGHILRNSLLNKLNPEGKRVVLKYRLSVEITESKEELAYRKDMAATRSDLEINVKYKLNKLNDGDLMLDEEIKSISSYDVVESVYATLVAEKDAREKSLEILSDDIYTNLVIFFKNK